LFYNVYQISDPSSDAGSSAVTFAALIDGDHREIIPGVTVYTGGRHAYASRYLGVATREATQAQLALAIANECGPSAGAPKRAARSVDHRRNARCQPRGCGAVRVVTGGLQPKIAHVRRTRKRIRQVASGIGRQVLVEQQANAHLQHVVLGGWIGHKPSFTVCGERVDREEVFTLEIRKVRENFSLGHAGREIR
jgi:hypothetical protein